MTTNKHLTLSERLRISNLLEQHFSFKAIGIELNKDCTTISKEIRNHIIFRKVGYTCQYRYICDKQYICTNCAFKRNKSFCRFCRLCNSNCPDFKQKHCNLLKKAPYVCNGCDNLKKCTLEKHFYHGDTAYTEYKEILSEARQGISLTELEVKHLDALISPLIIKNNQLTTYVLIIRIQSL